MEKTVILAKSPQTDLISPFFLGLEFVLQISCCQICQNFLYFP